MAVRLCDLLPGLRVGRRAARERIGWLGRGRSHLNPASLRTRFPVFGHIDPTLPPNQLPLIHSSQLPGSTKDMSRNVPPLCYENSQDDKEY